MMRSRYYQHYYIARTVPGFANATVRPYEMGNRDPADAGLLQAVQDRSESGLIMTAVFTATRVLAYQESMSMVDVDTSGVV